MLMLFIKYSVVQSVMDANKHLVEEVDYLKKTLEREQQKAVTKDEDEVKRLKKRIEQLENVEVITSDIKSDIAINEEELQQPS